MLDERFKEIINSHLSYPAGPDIQHALTGLNVRKLLNCAVALSTGYLECGVYTGGTFCAAMYGNKTPAIAIDSWAEEFGITKKWGKHPRNEFERNTAANVKTPFTMIQSDHWDVRSLPFMPDLFFYDGDHSQAAQEKALTHYAPMLADEFIYIVDDYNWSRVQVGTDKGIVNAGLKLLGNHWFGISKTDDALGYWNGVGVFLFKKL